MGSPVYTLPTLTALAFWQRRKMDKAGGTVIISLVLLIVTGALLVLVGGVLAVVL